MIFKLSQSTRRILKCLLLYNILIMAEIMCQKHNLTSCTGHCCSFFRSGTLSSLLIACHIMTPVKPGSSNCFPVKEKCSPPTSKYTVVCRYLQSGLIYNSISHSWVFIVRPNNIEISCLGPETGGLYSKPV